MIFNADIFFDLLTKIITTMVSAYAIAIFSDSLRKYRFVFIQVVVTTIISYMTSYIFPSLETFSFLLQFIIFLILSIVLLDSSKKISIMATIVGFVGMIITEICVITLWTLITGSDVTRITVYSNHLMSLFITVIWVLFALVIYTIIYYIWNFFRKKQMSKYTLVICAFPITQELLLFFSYNLIIALGGNKTYFLFLTLLAILSVVADTALFFILKRIYYKDMLQEKAKYMEKELEYERLYYSRIKGDIEKTNKIRHDIKNQLQSIYVLLEKNNKKDTKKIIKEIEDRIATTEKRFCSNKIVDAVLLEKDKACGDLNIKFKCDISLNEQKVISNLDLCSVFSNIMDNAIKACECVTDPYIELSVKCNKGYIIICEKNNKLNIEKKNKPSRSLIKEHGLGLSIIKDIVNKYDGKVEINNYEKTFEIMIWMKSG